VKDEPRDNPVAPHPQRFPPNTSGFATIMAAHDAAMAEGQSGYLDPFTGLFVMTAGFHLNRGHCCHNGCRHCLYVGAQDTGAQEAGDS